MIFEKRPPRIEAMKVTGENINEVAEWCNGFVKADGTLMFPASSEIMMPVPIGSYLKKVGIDPFDNTVVFECASSDVFEQEWELIGD